MSTISASNDAASTRLVNRYFVLGPKILPLLLVAIASLVGIAILIKAAQTGLTYDEAYSLTVFAQSAGYLLWMDQANNQLLNTVLIYVIKSSLGNSEFMLRLPNVLCGFLYLSVAVRFANRTKFPVLAFSLLVFLPYLMDFFSLARGYGIATSFVLLALVCYPREQTIRAFCLSCIYLFVASIAIYSTFVLLLALIGTAVLAKILEKGVSDSETRCFAAVGLSFTALAVVPAYLLAQVTAPGKDLFATRDNFILTYLYTIDSFFDFEYASWFFVFLTLITLALLGMRYAKMRASTTQMIALNGIVLFAYFTLAKISGRPFPTGRVLLPLYPMHAVTFTYVIEDLASVFRNRGVRDALTISAWMLSSLLALNFVLNLDLTATRDWYDNRDILPTLTRALADRTCVPRSIMENPAAQYYRDRLGMQSAWDQLKCP